MMLIDDRAGSPKSRPATRTGSFLAVLFALAIGIDSGASSAQPSVDPRSEALKRALEGSVRPEGLRISVVLREPQGRLSRSARREQIQQRQARSLARIPRGSFEARHRYRAVNGFAGVATREAIEAMLDDPDVLAIDVDRVAIASVIEGASLVGAPAVHSSGYTGAGITVAVLDTGIDTDHPDLSSNLVAEACFCNECCSGGADTATGSGAAEDDNGHGTQVSGIVASTNGSRPGIAYDAGIAAVKVLAADGVGNFSDIADGLEWVIDNRVSLNIKVVNISIGDGEEHATTGGIPCNVGNTANLIGQLESLGVSVFVASGNEGYDAGISHPACVAEAISVGGVYDKNVGSVQWAGCTDSTTSANKFVCHTNSSSLLDVVAQDFATRSTAMGGGHTTWGGTSAASPYAAGQAALLLEIDDAITPSEMLTHLTTGSPMVTNPGNGLSFPRTRVDQAAALLAAVCGNGVLEAGEACDDGNTNPGDCCDGSCEFESGGSSCNDGNFCTLTDSCDGAGTCVGSGTPSCDDSNSCTDDACIDFVGCQNSPNTDPCDDGNTTVDACSGGACSGSGALSCDDSNPCTDDQCVDFVGCQNGPNSAPCDDADACTTGDSCAGSVCLPGGPTVCDDSNPCTDDGCISPTGCSFIPNSATCDDGSVCSQNEACEGGACVAGSMLDCDDGDQCTADSCDELLGCAHEPIVNCPPVPTIPGLSPLGALLAMASLMGTALVRIRLDR